MKINSNLKNNIISITLIITSSLISLIFAELFLILKNSNMKNYDVEMWKYSRKLKQKSSNKILDFVHKKNKKARLQNVDIRINEFGLRGENLIKNKSSKRRILFLGGSITLGWGVKEENTLTANIEKLFSQNGKDVEILNAGIGNYNSERYVERFLNNLSFLEPTDIVVNYYLRDAENLKPSKSNFLIKRSQLALTIWTAQNRLFKPSGEDNLINHYKAFYDQDNIGFIKMKESLNKLSNYAKANDINIYILMTPEIQNLENYQYLFIHKIIKKIANEYDYIFVDSLPLFKNRKFETLHAMPGDPHPNALGHQLMSEAIFPFLNKEL